MTLRKTTNLVVPDQLKMNRRGLGQAFMYVYTKKYTGSEVLFFAKLWMSTVFPELVKNPKFGQSRKGIKSYVEYVANSTPAAFTRIVKVDGPDPHFVASVPLLSVSPASISFTESHIGSFLASSSDSSRHEELTEKLQSNGTSLAIHKYGGEEVLRNAQFDARSKAELEKTLLNLHFESTGSKAIIFADFKITKAEAQQLTTTPWLELRPMDLYPLLLAWTASQFGYTHKAPVTSFPISKIARTLPAPDKGQPKINEFGLSVGPDGSLYYLPEKLDNTALYESMYATAGNRTDGSFGLHDLLSSNAVDDNGNIIVKTKLPTNVPVLIDWTNNRYSYTTSTGLLKVQDLTRFRTASITHIATHLHRPLDKSFLALAAAAGVVGGIADGGIGLHVDDKAALEASGMRAEIIDRLDSSYSLTAYMAVATLVYTQTEEQDVVRMEDLTIKGHPVFRPIARRLSIITAAVLNNLDAVYSKYAVSTMTLVIAKLMLLDKYGDKVQEVVLSDNEARKAAIGQGVTEDWVPPSIPLLSNKVGLLPHQKKVRNLLKDSPDFAILPIQAGGGKSPLTIIDILYEIKANRSQPYLILCPAHLVAQYVKELVFFTNGKLNAIPINSYTLTYNGYKRLTKMLANAPRNTVVVCDYDALRFRQEQLCYGTSEMIVYPVIEFLKQFNFGYVMCDEAHYLKNNSGRTRATMSLITDIPKKRLASGTMAHDSPSDLALQIANLDPTLFGSRQDFNETYGEVVSGDRVIKWKPGSQRQIMDAIRSRVVVAGAMRKEWAALLPNPVEKFHPVELNIAQREVYELIFDATMEQIMEAAKTNKKLASFLGGGKNNDGEDDGDSRKEDEEEEVDLSKLLNPYLARLEQFITAPASDPLGDKMLIGSNRVSPKIGVIIDLIREHIAEKIPGKILIFTNYIESAEEIYAQLPADLQTRFILYKAANKIEAGSKFENDDRMIGMVGVENSMNTGLNLQFVSRLIRMEAVWGPGTLEQGNSRVNRPELKKADRRDKIYYNWIIADKTIDITKISRLISKIIASAKFDNADSGRYEVLNEEKTPVIPMNLETIRNMNDWADTLKPYADVYAEYKQIQHDEYAEYRAEHGDLVLEALDVAAAPKDAKLMSMVPYTPGLELYNQSELGLVRLDEYLRSDEFEDMAGNDDAQDDESKMDKKQLDKKRISGLIVGQKVHTEFGDGDIRSISLAGRNVIVDLDSGYAVRSRLSSTFLITRPITSTKDIKNQILKSIGELPVDKPVDVPAFIMSERAEDYDEDVSQDETKRPGNKGKKVVIKKTMKRTGPLGQSGIKKEVVKEEVKAPVIVELDFSIANGFFAIKYFTDKSNPQAELALQALGFVTTPQFVYAEIRNAKRLLNQFNKWREAGFTLDKSVGNIAGAFHDMYDLLKSGRIRSNAAVFNYSTTNNLRNFFRYSQKPSVHKKMIKPYPIIEDGEALIALPLKGQSSTLAAIRVKAAGVVFARSSPSLSYYGLDQSHISAMMKRVVNSGIQISNLNDLRKQFTKIKKIKIRKDEDVK